VIGGRGDGEGTARQWKKETEGGAHQRRGRQQGCGDNVADCGLLWPQRLEEGKGECNGGLSLTQEGEETGRGRKRGARGWRRPF
jgi:hypothetical protein